MGRGSNGKPSRTITSTQHDNHTGDHIVNISTPPAFSQKCSVASTSSAPNKPRGTANRAVQFSGTTVDSFNNYEKGSQDFSVATINSSRTGDSFNNLREGSQTFRGAEIRCVDDNSGKRTIASLFTRKRDQVANHAILHSFNNAGNGSQTFDGANINCGHN